VRHRRGQRRRPQRRHGRGQRVGVARVLPREAREPDAGADGPQGRRQRGPAELVWPVVILQTGWVFRMFTSKMNNLQCVHSPWSCRKGFVCTWVKSVLIHVARKTMFEYSKL
jgi:hypothetical protein